MAKPNSQVTVRRARPADSRAILVCLENAFAPYRDQYTLQAFADTVLDETSIARRLEEMCVFVALEDQTVIGTVGGSVAEGGEGHLRGMAVLPAVQGAGVAARLLRAIEDDLRNRGCRRVTLDTTLPLKAAMRFYEKHGYARSGRIADFFAMPLIEYVKQL